MKKVILVLVVFALILPTIFAALPELPNNSDQSNAQIIAQIQQTQTMVVTTSEALGGKMVEIKNDINGMSKEISELRNENANLKMAIETKPSAAIMVLACGAVGAIIAAYFIRLKSQGKW